MIYEDPDALGYSTDESAFCDDHFVTVEECADCGGLGFWQHAELGQQPCVNCMGEGIVPHTCASEDDVGDGRE